MNSLEMWSYWKDLLPDYLERDYEELGFLQEVIEVEPDRYGGTNRVFYFKEGVFYTCLSHWDGGNFMANRSYEHTALSKEAFTEILDKKKSNILSTLPKDEKLEFELVFNDVTSLLFSKFE